MPTSGKYILVIFLLVVITLPFVASGCNSIFSNVGVIKRLPMCYQETINATHSQLDHLKQLTLATPVKNGLSEYMNLMVLSNIIFGVWLVGGLMISLYFIRKMAYHMKPWDPLRLAFARGIIQRKLLD